MEWVSNGEADLVLVTVGAAAFLLGAALAAWIARGRVLVSRPSSDVLVRDLCDLNGRIATDPVLAELLLRYIERPAELDRVDRVRARAWFDTARRLHRLLAEALDREPDVARRAAEFAPSMGEGAANEGLRFGAHEDAHRVSNVTLIDPEFMAWVEAMRERRRA